jgi:hypothetical protein
LFDFGNARALSIRFHEVKSLGDTIELAIVGDNREKLLQLHRVLEVGLGRG